MLDTDEEVATALPDGSGVTVVPGSAFGLAGHFRIAYANDEESLLTACGAIQQFCRTLI